MATIRGYDTNFIISVTEVAHTYVYIPVYIETLVQYRTAIVKTSCLTMLDN